MLAGSARRRAREVRATLFNGLRHVERFGKATRVVQLFGWRRCTVLTVVNAAPVTKTSGRFHENCKYAAVALPAGVWLERFGRADERTIVRVSSAELV